MKYVQNNIRYLTILLPSKDTEIIKNIRTYILQPIPIIIVLSEIDPNITNINDVTKEHDANSFVFISYNTDDLPNIVTNRAKTPTMIKNIS